MLTTISGDVPSAMSDNALGATSDQSQVVTYGVVPANTPEQEKGVTVTGVPVGIPSCVPAATPAGVTGFTISSLPAAAPQQAQTRDPDEAPCLMSYLIPPTQTKTGKNRRRFRMNKRMARAEQV
jgi:hypothetical protein